MKLFQMKLPEKDNDVDVSVVPADVVAVLDVSAIIQEWKKQLQWLQDYQCLNNQLAQRFHSVLVITLTSHTRGPRFESRRNQLKF